ncbi:MAG: hypothetical protein ACJA0X_002237 [Cyclobacteriaceae bacterium]|jgi:hypothetical protein
MKIFSSLLFLFCFTSSGYTQKQSNIIPDSLANNTNEVILYDNTNFIVNDLHNSSLKRTYKVLVKNKFAKDKTEIQLWYDNFREIEYAIVTISDENEELVESYKLKDFNDYSEKSFSLASDSRSKYLDITHKKYPYFLEVSYRIVYKTSYIMPSWYPQSSAKQSVVSATLSVQCPADLPLRFKSLNIEPDSTSQNENIHNYHWSIKNLAAYNYEPFSSYVDRSPIVFLAPTKFQLDGHTGDMSSWKSFGSWNWELNKLRNTLTYEDLRPIFNLVDGASSKVDSIRRVYKYVQKNTHYVSIQLGIGGMQPFETGFVHKNKFGDCKALSYYTQCLLSGIGIKSYYTLVYGGSNPQILFPDFPDDYFNHIILTVPLEKDTVWLECTSQTNPFGNLGTFTGNRKALMITEDGGKLINTKSYSLTDNTQQTTAVINLDKDGNADLNIIRSFKGMEIENDNFERVYLMTKEEQANWLVDNHHWGQMNINNYTIKGPNDSSIPEASFELDSEIKGIGKKSGDRIFFNPFLLTQFQITKLPKIARLNPIHINYPFTQIDTIRVNYPQGIYIEKDIKSKALDTEFGTYSHRSYSGENGMKIYVRKFEFYNGTYSADSYDSFRDFVKSVQKYDNEKLVYINRT